MAKGGKCKCGGKRMQKKSRTIYECRICFKSHPLKHCKRFQAMSIKERQRVVRFHKYCVNCFAHDHFVNKCTSKSHCGHCKKAHHTMLHLDLRRNLSSRSSSLRGSPARSVNSHSRSVRDSPSHSGSSKAGSSHDSRHRSARTTVSPAPTAVTSQTQNVQALASHLRTSESILLPTVLCTLRLLEGKTLLVRCLLNTGLPYSVVYGPIVEKSGFPSHKVDNMTLCSLTLESIHDSTMTLEHLFRTDDEMETITPSVSIPSSSAQLYRNIKLADPSFYQRDDIDFIFGMDLYSKVVIPGEIVRPGQPNIINTIFGYAVSGPYVS